MEKDLLEYQYKLEKEYARQIKESQPFSEERAQITKEAYQNVNEIIELRNKGQSAFGFQKQYVDMIRQFLKKGDTFFEAGVGTGSVIKEILKIPDITVMGCDTFLDPQFLDETTKCKLTEDTLYHSLLKLKDCSIDFFYWNDVMEHICPDEIEETLKILYKKMKSGGTVFSITPNALTGPHDITRFVDKKEKTAHGLHLKEYTYTEVQQIFHRAGFITKGHFIKIRKKDIYISCFSKLYDRLKVLLEKMLRIVPVMLLKRYEVYRYELNVSVMQKNEYAVKAKKLF